MKSLYVKSGIFFLFLNSFFRINDTGDKIKSAIQDYYKNYPQEKIYGSENYGITKQCLNKSDDPKIKHTIAQVDIHFSNSIIEAANKQLKYRFLYH